MYFSVGWVVEGKIEIIGRIFIYLFIMKLWFKYL